MCSLSPNMLNGRIAALVLVLSEGDEAGQCPLSKFVRSIRESSKAQQQRSSNGGLAHGDLSSRAASAMSHLSDIVAERSLALTNEEEAILRDMEAVRLTYDKLRAEVARVEAQLQSLERRAQEVAQQKAFCKTAMNMLVLGELPEFFEREVDVVGRSPRENVGATTEVAAAATIDGPNEVPTSSNSPRRSARSVVSGKFQQRMSAENGGDASSPDTTGEKRGEKVAPDESSEESSSSEGDIQARRSPPDKGNSSFRGSSGSGNNNCPSGNALLSMLRLPDVKETTLLHAIESYDEQNFRRSSWTLTQQKEVSTVLVGLLKHILHPRPPIQLAELRILGHVVRAAFGNQSTVDSPSVPMSRSPTLIPEAVAVSLLHTMLKDGAVVTTFIRLLQSVNDDVKCEVLECLSPLIINSNNNNNNSNANSGSRSLSSKVLDPAGEGRRQLPDGRKEFIAAGGLQPLVNIVASCTSEAVLERSLVLLWSLLARNDDEDKVRDEVRRLGGLRAVLDLLYTDSIPILENVAMTIGYITREEASKVAIREAGGLEKLTATLRHPYESIQTKVAGAVWNCASNAENRTYLRYIGCIPALIELLSSPQQFVQENAAGALWNLSVDSENKTQILEYGGITELAHLIAKSTSVSVVENASGTLWNCSAAVETRPAIRKAGAIPVLLSVLDRKSQTTNPRRSRNEAPTASGSKDDLGGNLPISDKILDNVAGTLRNCAINDQNKPVIREAGGVELLLKKLEQGIVQQPSSIIMPTLDKIASTLWILTISPEIKHSVRLSGGIPLLTKILEISSTTAAKEKNAKVVVPVMLSVKEKIVGILRNCSTVQENRQTMVSAGVVRALVYVVDDCYQYPESCQNTRRSSSNTSQSQQQQQPSLQLKETVASALWYLSRDDKVVPREERGLELLCRFLLEPDQPSVVLEQAAGALSSLTVNSRENRAKLREFGGLHALLQLIAEKAPLAFPPQSAGASGAASATNTATATASTITVNRATTSSSTFGTGTVKKENTVSHAYAVLNGLLAVRNSTSSNDENLCCVAEWKDPNAKGNTAAASSFTNSLLYIIQHGSEDCAREAVLCVKNLCGHATALDSLIAQDAVEVLGGLAERGSTDSVRRAAAMTLHSLARARKR
ncbi:Armadillo/beta-catenin-like repeat [Trypanosoma brucei equiperdum]|uniref:Armadillo/beta-catenin-like repeat n=1 Tax=Trypanosoma brucei equiperdum TaxID=630700 RepID=A0A3L6KXM3_9TRYP|nr:Armadillo/beta-catenin-like repeat [Trypanosoma brucei equiperdum]